MQLRYSFLISFILLLCFLLSSCTNIIGNDILLADVVHTVDIDSYYPTQLDGDATPSYCWFDGTKSKSPVVGVHALDKPSTHSLDGVLHVVSIVHIEPDYASKNLYDRDRARMQRMLEIANERGYKLTIEAQPLFSDWMEQTEDSLFTYAAATGHEIAIHFHENKYVGGSSSPDALFDAYVSGFRNIKEQLEELCDCSVRTWSGGNTYSEIYEAASAAGLSVNTNFKDRRTQLGDVRLATTNPWTPLSGGTADKLLHYDPEGSIVFIPNGIYPLFCEKAGAVARPYTEQSFQYTTNALYASLQEMNNNNNNNNNIHVFTMTWHPGDFGVLEDDEEEFAAWETWLDEVLVPLEKSGVVEFSTASDVAEEFLAWRDMQ
jgi:hypothetical protein